MPKQQNKQRKGWKDLPLLARGGIVILGTYGLYRLIKEDIVDSPDRVNCNTMSIPGDMREDLSDLASDLYGAMRGTNVPLTGSTDRSNAWKQLADYEDLNDQALCFIHNYWIKKVDEEESLLSWIEAQIVLPWSQEDVQRDRAIKSLKRAGLK